MSLEAAKSHPRFEGDYVAVALIAGALASVREDAADHRSLAAQLGGEAPVMSELRFLRLMRAADLDDFYRQLQRALQLASRKTDVAVLANDIVAWLLEQTSPLPDPNQRFKARWARDYYLPARERAVVEKSNLETLV
jgi:CRISPR system Cascade subunit CasB